MLLEDDDRRTKEINLSMLILRDMLDWYPNIFPLCQGVACFWYKGLGFIHSILIFIYISSTPFAIAANRRTPCLSYQSHAAIFLRDIPKWPLKSMYFPFLLLQILLIFSVGCTLIPIDSYFYKNAGNLLFTLSFKIERLHISFKNHIR